MAYFWTLLGLFLVFARNFVIGSCASAVEQNGFPQNVWIRLDRAVSWEEVRVVFAIKQSNTGWLEKKAEAVSDPESPDYSNYMNFDEIAQHVHGDYDSVSAVVGMLKLVGVEKERIHFTLGQDFAVVHLPVATAEEVFQTEFYYYQHAIDHKRQVVRSEEYTLPFCLSGHVDYVLGVSIHDLPRSSLRAWVPLRSKGSDEDTSIDAKVVTPQRIQESYNISWYVASNPHTSQSVISFRGQYYSPKDLEIFLKQFHLTGGKIDTLGFNNASDPSFEADLDIQYIFSGGQGVSTSFVSIPASLNTPFEDFLSWVLNEINSTTSSLVHSLSYADIEDLVDPAYRVRTEFELKKFAVSGRTVLIASADSGVLCNKSTHSFTPYWPSSSPYVTSVGGTMPDIKTVWMGSGGGFSNVNPAPKYQNEAVRKYLNKNILPDQTYFNTAGRGYPDLSAFAVGCRTINDGKAWDIDGTSCATPIVAGEFHCGRVLVFWPS